MLAWSSWLVPYVAPPELPDFLYNMLLCVMLLLDQRLDLDELMLLEGTTLVEVLKGSV